jgi:hypothetical protein
MAINKVGSKGIEDGSVASADFAPNTVTSAKLQDGAVTNAKLTNTSVTLAGSSVSLGGSVSFNNKFVDWQSVITADGSTGTTAVAGNGYFIDTTSAAHTLTLPASATIGDFIAIKDYAGTFGTNNLTIARNGHNIQGVANDSLITTNRASLVLVYVDSTKGWLYWEEHNVADLGVVSFTSATGGTVVTSGDFKIHVFTGSDCFVVSSVGNNPVNPVGGPSAVDYLVVAGGGGSSGGGGGFREGRQNAPDYTASPLVAPGGLPISVTTYPVTVGAGGSGGAVGTSSIFSTITSAGGGAGVNNPAQTSVGPSGAGGSGGGAGGFPTSSPNLGGGLGNTPPTSPPQGNNGGDTGTVVGGQGIQGGGGGAGAVGGNGSHPTGTGGVGGIGASTAIYCSPTVGTPGPAPGRYFAGGGGGGSYNYPQSPGPGQSPGGAGGGGPAQLANGTNGTANTGGGGGRGQTVSVGSGGKGIVIIRYKYQ